MEKQILFSLKVKYDYVLFYYLIIDRLESIYYFILLALKVLICEIRKIKQRVVIVFLGKNSKGSKFNFLLKIIFIIKLNIKDIFM